MPFRGAFSLFATLFEPFRRTLFAPFSLFSPLFARATGGFWVPFWARRLDPNQPLSFAPPLKSEQNNDLLAPSAQKRVF